MVDYIADQKFEINLIKLIPYVDRSTLRHYKFHLDYLSILRGWCTNVKKRHYRRHLNNLKKSVRLEDWLAYFAISRNLFISVFLMHET